MVTLFINDLEIDGSIPEVIPRLRSGMPPSKRKSQSILIMDNLRGKMSIRQISTATNIPQSSVRRNLHLLKLLGKIKPYGGNYDRKYERVCYD